MFKNNRKLDILLKVCNYKEYEIGIKDNKYTLYRDGNKSDYIQYDSLDIALIEWLPHMESIDESMDEWTEEIKYIKDLKKKIEMKKFLYDNLDISFSLDNYEKNLGVMCEFTIHTPIKPMMKVKRLKHYMDENKEVSNAYVEIFKGRIERDFDVDYINVWIFEPSMERGGEFLHNANILNYDVEELEEEIIKRWEVQRKPNF